MNYKAALEALRGAVERVYDSYKAQIDRQHNDIEAWMDTAVARPSIQTRLSLLDGFQYLILYPVPISDASDIDDRVVQELLDVVDKNGTISQVIDGPPVVRAVIKS